MVHFRGKFFGIGECNMLTWEQAECVGWTEAEGEGEGKALKISDAATQC
jgi:hypothetical protein